MRLLQVHLLSPLVVDDLNRNWNSIEKGRGYGQKDHILLLQLVLPGERGRGKTLEDETQGPQPSPVPGAGSRSLQSSSRIDHPSHGEDPGDGRRGSREGLGRRLYSGPYFYPCRSSWACRSSWESETTPTRRLCPLFAGVREVSDAKGLRDPLHSTFVSGRKDTGPRTVQSGDSESQE